MARKILLGLMVLSIMAMGSNALAQKKIKYGNSFKGSVQQDVVMIAAEEGGFWKKNNLNIEWIPFTFRGGGMYQAMAAKAVDIGIAEVSSAVRAITGGVPMVIVADIGTKQWFRIYVLGKGPIKSTKDLKGTKLGTSRTGGASEAYGRVMLKALGMEKDVKLVAAGGVKARIAGVKSGVLDGFVQTVSPVANLVVAGELRELISSKQFLPQPWMGHVLVARRDWLKKNPELARRAIKATFQGTAWLMKNPDWVRNILKTRFNFQGEAAVLMMKEPLQYGKDPRLSRKALENVIKFLEEFKLLPPGKSITVDQVYTNDYIS